MNITPLNFGKCGTAVLVQFWTAVIFLDQYTSIVRQSALEPGLGPLTSCVFSWLWFLANFARVLGLSRDINPDSHSISICFGHSNVADLIGFRRRISQELRQF